MTELIKVMSILSKDLKPNDFKLRVKLVDQLVLVFCAEIIGLHQLSKEVLMKRRTFLQEVIVLPALSFLLSARLFASNINERTAIEPLNKPHEAWRGLVSPEAYRILFEEHTEEPGSSELNHEHREGTFICAACYLPLFESQHKFESGTGWPSFTQPIPGHTGTRHDFKLIFLRVEYHCARCGGHQGHIFKDGPPPRGERWCNNGLALKFVLKIDQLPELRV